MHPLPPIALKVQRKLIEAGWQKCTECQRAIPPGRMAQHRRVLHDLDPVPEQPRADQ